MKLYFAPGACSLAPHILLREAGLDFELEKVDLQSKQTASGGDFWAINPKGGVPALELDGGEILTEAAVILQYVADLVPDKGLMPAAGGMPRYRAQEWLNFVATELHKGFAPLFNPQMPDAAKELAKEALFKRFEFVNSHLAKQGDYLLGSAFSAADAYLLVTLSWARYLKLDISAFEALVAFQRRVSERPSVQAAMEAEGLLKR